MGLFKVNVGILNMVNYINFHKIRSRNNNFHKIVIMGNKE